ncbi:hypothetical protein QBC34DRAFT_77347 [Podospora aff. communis PSN243]|uniref:Uncharacterized protein n=1 Tax=Podospora aff. communis PSN243 TaxID=3040156 RepID=A0AAV9GS69_9PEZI|nr:hypothetical protein QBC34DRAFT_77347 [Podospora aff. communis PSN243]
MRIIISHQIRWMTRASAAARENERVLSTNSLLRTPRWYHQGRLSCGHIGLPMAFDLALGFAAWICGLDVSPAARLACLASKWESATQKCEGKAVVWLADFPLGLLRVLPPSKQWRCWSKYACSKSVPRYLSIFSSFSPLCTIAQASLLKRGAKGGDRGGITHCTANQRARRPSEQSQLPSCRGGRFRLVGSLGRGVVGQMPTVSRHTPSIPERCIGAAVHLTSIYLMASGFRGATAAF